MNTNIKRFIAIAFSMTLISSLAISSLALNKTDGFTMDQATSLLKENNFTIVSGNKSIDQWNGISSTETSSVSITNRNFLFETASFETALQQPEEVKEMILNGNVVAVFDSNGITQTYEEEIGLPIGFDDEEDTAAENGITVGRIYCTDSVGNLHIARVRVDSKFGEEDAKFNEFAKRIDQFMDENVLRSTNSGNMDFLGSVTDYFTGESEKGDIDATYEVSTAQSIDGYDYYTVHGYIDYTPGRALHNNGYDIDEFKSILSASGIDATLYKTGPDTMLGVNQYSVDVGFTGSKDGVSVRWTI